MVAVFMAMEFLDGVTLKEFIRRGPLDLETLIDIAIQVVDGLAAAHKRGIVHRDIKPANILVTAEQRAKILDFGLAKVATPFHAKAIAGSEDETLVGGSGEYMTTAGTTLGTMPYMSPEQALGKPLDARTDLFSFGVTLYEMATGEMPFHGDTTGVLFLSIVQDTPVPPTQLNPSLPAELQLVINKCLEKDRELRYQEASHILFDLKRLGRESSRHTSGASAAIEEATVHGGNESRHSSGGIGLSKSTSLQRQVPSVSQRRSWKSWALLVCRCVCAAHRRVRLLEIAQDSSAHREGQHRACGFHQHDWRCCLRWCASAGPRDTTWAIALSELGILAARSADATPDG